MTPTSPRPTSPRPTSPRPGAPRGTAPRPALQVWQEPAWPRFAHDPARTEAALAAAQEALGEVAGLQAALGPEDLEQLRLAQIVQEAMSSFEIEGVSLDAGQIEASVVASLRHRDRIDPERRADAIAALMLAARRAEGALTAAQLMDWHRLLFFGLEIEDPGRWRRFEIEIVRSAMAGRHEVLYRAPPPERLAAEMARFLDWLAAPPVHPLPVQAALAHLWFESIHPFSDGNGRIGRALVEHVFARGRALPFSLSRQIGREKKAYYAALQAGRQPGVIGGVAVIDATPFVLWFLECLAGAARAGQAEARHLVRRNAFFLRFGPGLSARQERALRLVFEQGPARVEEGLSARGWRRMTGVSGPTATRDLAALEALGALVRGPEGGRSLRYALVAG